MSSSTRPAGGGSTGISYGDEGLPDSWMMDYEEGGSIISTEMAQNERTIHANFFNDFDDIFNDEDLD